MEPPGTPGGRQAVEQRPPGLGPGAAGLGAMEGEGNLPADTLQGQGPRGVPQSRALAQWQTVPFPPRTLLELGRGWLARPWVALALAILQDTLPPSGLLTRPSL